LGTSSDGARLIDDWLDAHWVLGSSGSFVGEEEGKGGPDDGAEAEDKGSRDAVLGIEPFHTSTGEV
jgi:hypothetical protein